MKILSLSLDNSILDKNSSLAKRIVEYGNLVEKYTVIAPNKENKNVILSEQADAIGVAAGNKMLVLFKIYRIAKKLLFKKKYNIITVQDQYYLALAGLLLAKKFKIGLEIQIHGFEKYSSLRKIIAKFVIPKANAVRTVSQRLKNRLMDEFGVDEGRITVAPVYTRITNYELRIKNQKKDDKFIFLTVGRLVPVKNIEMQIRAIKNLELRIKNYELRIKNLELWIVGEGKESKKLEVRSKKLEVEKYIKFFGWQEDLGKFYRQADVFLLTSNSEGWGMAVIEAASYGLPIIMTDVGCAGEFIVNGKSGIVISTRGQKKLEQAMVKLIQNNELRKKIGENAKQAVVRLPSKQKILELYKESWEMACKV